MKTKTSVRVLVSIIAVVVAGMIIAGIFLIPSAGSAGLPAPGASVPVNSQETEPTIDPSILDQLRPSTKPPETTPTEPVKLPDDAAIRENIFKRSEEVRSLSEHIHFKQHVEQNGKPDDMDGEMMYNYYPQTGGVHAAMQGDDGSLKDLYIIDGKYYRTEDGKDELIPFEPKETETLVAFDYKELVKLATDEELSIDRSDVSEGGPLILSFKGKNGKLAGQVIKALQLSFEGFDLEKDFDLDLSFKVEPRRYDVTAATIHLVSDKPDIKVDIQFDFEFTQINNLRELPTPPAAGTVESSTKASDAADQGQQEEQTEDGL